MMVVAFRSMGTTTTRTGAGFGLDRSCWPSGWRRWGARSPSSRATPEPVWTSGSRLSDMAIRLVVADDHAVVLKGLEALLALEQDLTVVATCTNGNAALDAVQKHRPD